MRGDADQLATRANLARNARAERDRARRWSTARAAAGEAIEPLLGDRARVAVLGAGQGDHLPLDRLAARAAALTLLDVDPRALRHARRTVGRGQRRRIELVEHDVTLGAADRIVAAARAIGPVPEPPAPSRPEPLPGAPHDLVVTDLVSSQLLFPGLLDAEIPLARRRAVLARCGSALTDLLCARAQASAPVVLHLHDQLCWTADKPQPVALDAILATPDLDAALALAARGLGPAYADPRPALTRLGIAHTPVALWRWPFAPGTDYLVVATRAGA